MKNYLNKLTAKFKRGRKNSDKSSVPRITNDTLAEHREAVISKGKRYKYPMQQTKNRTVIISTLIAAGLLIGVASLTWWQLYRAQNTSQFMYRITQILPLSVASVDGETVLYRDYLMELRSALHYLQEIEAVNLASDSGQRQLAYQKRQSMDRVLEQAYVRKLASENNVEVSSEDVDAYVKQQIAANESGATEQDLRAVILEYYDWTFDEYRQSIKKQLLKQEVVAAVDDAARSEAEDVLRQAKGAGDFAKLAEQFSDDEATKLNGGDVGFVNTSDPDPDGLIAEAAGLEKDQVSDVIVGVNGLYVVKTLEKRAEQVRFARIFIRFNAFNEEFSALRAQGKIEEHIDVPTNPNVLPSSP